MRRFVLLLLVMGLVTVVTAVALAQDEEPEKIELVPIAGDGTAVPFTLNAGGNSCSAAATLTLPGGDSTNVSAANQEATDPVLACMWGTPPRSQGYRTTWYKFTAPYNGVVTISTLNSQYDTVLAVHTGTCDSLPTSLTTMACNDDKNGFTSEIRMNVSRNTTYFVEVADWHQGVDDPTLNLSIILDPIESKWQEAEPMAIPRSRHATAAMGDFIYLFGGQDENVYTGSPTNVVQRFNTATGVWLEVANMPGETGYMHTTAVAYQGAIYIPGGAVNAYYVGSQLTYDIDPTHRIYHPGLPGSWSTAASPAWPDAVPTFMSAAAPSGSPQKVGYYLIGGLAGNAPFLTSQSVRSDMLFYSTYSHDWHVEASMPEPRYGHTAVLLNGRICVAGGVNHNGGSLNLLTTGTCFNDATDTWTATGPMKYPRYGADSVVGPDGRWYVFGGIGASGFIPVTEVYNPATNQWTALDVTYDLGGSETIPPRAWVQGETAQGAIWAIGGEKSGVFNPSELVEKLQLASPAPFHGYIPFASKPGFVQQTTYDNFAEAQRLWLNQSQQHNFDTQLDFVDMFFFDLTQAQQVQVQLRQIPPDHNLDLEVYNANKLLYGESTNLAGQDENLTLNLPSGRYYVVVKRIFPIGEPDPSVYYKVKVEG